MPSWHSTESGQLKPWHCGQHNKEGKETVSASPSTQLCPQERGCGAGSTAGGVWRGQEQALGESQLI